MGIVCHRLSTMSSSGAKSRPPEVERWSRGEIVCETITDTTSHGLPWPGNT